MAEHIINGNLENWTSTTDCDDWGEWTSGSCTVTREDTVVHNGDHAVKLTQVGGAVAYISQIDNLLTAGNPYILTFYYKTTTSSATVHIGADTDPGTTCHYLQSGFVTWGASMQQHYLDAASTYTLWTMAFTLPSDRPNFRVIFTAGGNTSLYVDLVSLVDGEGNYVSDSTGFTLVNDYAYSSVSVKDNYKYYLGSSAGKVFTYSGDYLSDDGSAIVSRWRSKTLDFSDQIPKCADGFKELTGVKLIYKDLTTSTPVTIYVSTDGGQTWEHETKTLGTGSGEVLSANYHFIKTGEYFVLAIEHASTDKEFMWLHMEAKVVPLGAQFEI